MERYKFSPPIAEATVGLLKRANDASITKPADISGKAVGAGKATSQLTQLKQFGDTLPGKVDAREYPGFNEAYADLAAGRVVAVANSLTNLAYVAQQRPEAFALVKPGFGAKSRSTCICRGEYPPDLQQPGFGDHRVFRYRLPRTRCHCHHSQSR